MILPGRCGIIIWTIQSFHAQLDARDELTQEDYDGVELANVL